MEPPRWSFVPPDLDAGDLAALEQQFETLEQRPLDGPDAVAQWLRDESELQSRIGAEVARRYIRMTCETENTSARECGNPDRPPIRSSKCRRNSRLQHYPNILLFGSYYKLIYDLSAIVDSYSTRRCCPDRNAR